MKKQFQEDEVSIEYFWKHEGHTPGVLEDIKSQRLPQDLKAWIKRRIVEGYDWKAIKGMIQNGSPLLDEVKKTRLLDSNFFTFLHLLIWTRALF